MTWVSDPQLHIDIVMILISIQPPLSNFASTDYEGKVSCATMMRAHARVCSRVFLLFWLKLHVNHPLLAFVPHFIISKWTNLSDGLLRFLWIAFQMGSAFQLWGITTTGQDKFPTFATKFDTWRFSEKYDSLFRIAELNFLPKKKMLVLNMFVLDWQQI